MRFWGSSAVVPLLVAQPFSAATDRWIADDRSIAIWTLTPTEVGSAVRRLAREGRITESLADDAERRTDELVRACHVVVDVEAVKVRAARLLRVHAQGRVLHTFDDRLAAAARREGFAVLPTPG